ncbi:MAG TPA: DUF5990 family protein [Thermoanaerobaculia bacterium]
MKPRDRDLTLRIVVVDPPPGVQFAVQRGRDELVDRQIAGTAELRFDVAVQVRDGAGDLDFRGPFVQGKRGDRFVYVNSGTLAAQAGSTWTRRAKVKLGSITQEAVERALREAAGVLVARFAGRAKDGGPACATVPLLDGGWQVAAQTTPA